MANSVSQLVTGKKTNLIFTAILYILGLFMGALDTGIVSPARTIIQGGFNVDDKTGIWMITIYTLAYASIIPVAGKLADKLGRKYIYLASVLLFGTGSLICAFSSGTGSFAVLLAGRVIQAIGGGGIVPIATAEFGTSFPEEKRGMALGIIGGVYGIANIIGSSIGSAILSLAGSENWKWLFLINVPICIFIVAAGFFALANRRAENTRRIDKLGTLVLIALILLLLYGLKNINFFDFAATISSTSVYPYLIAFAVLLVPFIFIENRAEDPVLNLSYFTNSQILITLVLAFISGACIMGMVFVPQFSENALKIPAGSGGYFVAILGIFAGVASPLSGRFIDKYGPKAVMVTGLLISVIGGLFLAFVAASVPNVVTVTVSLVFIGLGIGFIMGAPLNYMMLANTRREDSNSALATLSLIRSVGTIISPAIMIGFIAQAGISVQGNLMDKLPPVPTNVKIVQAEELSKQMDELKANPKTAEMLKGVNIPDFKNMGSMNFDMTSGSGSIPEELLKELKTADVTNITNRTKDFAADMFDEKVPPVIKKIQDGVQTGIEKMNEGLSGMDKAQADMKNGADGIETGIANMSEGYAGISTGVKNMEAALKKQDLALSKMKAMYNVVANSAARPADGKAAMTGMPGVAGAAGMSGKQEIPGSAGTTEVSGKAAMAGTGNMPSPDGKMPSRGAAAMAGMPANIGGMPGKTGAMPANAAAMKPEALKAQIDKLSAARKQLAAQLKTNIEKQQELGQSIKQAEAQKKELLVGIAQMEEQKTLLKSTIEKMEELKAAVPSAFSAAKKDYLNDIEKSRGVIEGTFQSTMNNGFKQMYLAVAISNIVALLALLFYRTGKRKETAC